MYKILAFVAMLAIGMAGAVVDLSGTDPAVFDSAQFAKDGVSGGSESDLTSSQSAFLKDGNEVDAKLPGMKVALVGSLAKEAYLDGKPADLPTAAAQVEDYLNDTLNRSGVTVIDNLNVTEGE